MGIISKIREFDDVFVIARRIVFVTFEKLHVGSGVIAAGAAIFALFFGYYQIEVQRKMQSEAMVYEIYNNFLEKSLDYPDYVCVNTLQKLKMIDAKKDSKSDFGENLTTKYKLYRQLMMSTMEQILLAVPDHPDWVSSVNMRLKCHLPYFASQEFTTERYLGWKCVMRELIARNLESVRASWRQARKVRCSEREWQAEPKTGFLRPARIDFDKMLGSR